MVEDLIRGVNLTGWFSLETWVTPEVFAATGALSEADLIEALGTENYLRLVQNHRETFIVEQDFKEMAHRGFNAVRIPIPWYVFGQDGPFPGIHQSSIEILDKAFEWAEAYNMDVLLDINLVPGAKVAPDGLQMYVDMQPEYKQATLTVLSMLAKRYKDKPSFLGIEPLGEVCPQRRKGFSILEGVPLPRLRSFYRDAYDCIREAAGPDVVVVVSDAGLPGAWKHFMAQRRYENVWLDSHLYNFRKQENVLAPSGIRALMKHTTTALNKSKTSGLPVMVGEWSAALPIADSTMTPEGKIALERLYVSNQLSAFEGCSAWFFQTWKTSGRISSWDARVALSSFESDMLY